MSPSHDPHHRAPDLTDLELARQRGVPWTDLIQHAGGPLADRAQLARARDYLRFRAGFPEELDGESAERLSAILRAPADARWSPSSWACRPGLLTSATWARCTTSRPSRSTPRTGTTATGTGGTKPRAVPEPRYGSAHQAERALWAPVVEAGQAYCCETACVNPGGRWIRPGSEWHLAHTDDGQAYKGPAHQVCNCADGGSRSRTARPGPPRKARRRKPRGRGWSPTRAW